MIKKMLAIFLSVIYLLITVGFPISIHQCNSKGVSSVSFGHHEYCACSIETTNSCCSNTEAVKGLSCTKEIRNKPCCTNESKMIQWFSKQQIVIVDFINSDAKELVLLADFYFNSHSRENNNKQKFHWDLEAPPPVFSPVYKMNKQWILFG